MAVVLGILKLRNRGQVYMLQSFDIIFYMVECIRINSVLIATMSLKTSSARVLHHAGVAPIVYYEMRKLDEMGENVMNNKKLNTNFAFLVGMFQLPEKRGLSLCSDGRIFLL